MSLSIRLGDKTFTSFIASLSLPDRTGLVGEYLFGTDATQSLKNRAGATDLTAVGSPVYGSGYAEIRSGGAYGSVGFETGINCPTDATLIVVVRKDTAVPVWLSTIATLYSGFHNYLSAPVLYNQQTGTSAVTANVAAPTHSDYAFFAGALPQGGNGKIYTYTGGVLATDTAENVGSARLAGTLKFGTTLTNGGQGVARMAYGAIFNRVLTPTEVGAAYDSLKTYLTARGLTVS